MTLENAENQRRAIHRLVVPFAELPFEGVDLDVTERFQDLPVSESSADRELEKTFSEPIRIRGTITPVGSKVDVRAHFSTKISNVCDRCTVSFEEPIEGDLFTFLMPDKQFSAHDKPGGKVIHGPSRGQKKSRHHSTSKAPVLSDAEGEHEDVSFGAFDGDIVDLRGILREQLILSLPMSNLCAAECAGLCLKCGENINKGECKCPEGAHRLGEEKPLEKALSPLAAALQQKLKTRE